MSDKFCKHCGSKEDLKELRDFSCVCKKCISEGEGALVYLENQVNELDRKIKHPPSNTWNVVGAVIIFLAFASFLYGLLSDKLIFLLLSFPSFFIGIFFNGVGDKKGRKSVEPLKEERQYFEEKRKSAIQTMDKLYENYWEEPPDWSLRREKVIRRDGGLCKKCGRKKEGSIMPFYAHHMIPRREREGNHSLENLELRCEVCHSKEDGHELVERQREKRLEILKGIKSSWKRKEYLRHWRRKQYIRGRWGGGSEYNQD